MPIRKTIDLRSDTVTLPTEEMLESMQSAVRHNKVGDDYYGEDHTVNELEALAAEKMGKEAALFVSSGTQGNLCAILSQTTPGEEVLLGGKSHTYIFEVAGIARIGGLLTRTLPDPRGILTVEDILGAIQAKSILTPRTALLAVENTHNRAGGAIIPEAHLRRLGEVAKDNSLAFHLDGARIFNAAVGLGIDPRNLTQHVDSVTFCLSKGLSAPIGSLLCGSAALIARARRFRQMLGGGMRQVGVIAAAGLVALTTMVDRLSEDHRRAQILAQGLQKLDGVDVWPVETNILIFGVKKHRTQASILTNELKSKGILALAIDKDHLRMVTNRHIADEDIEYVTKVMQETL
ncbi:MAG: GntG family PLP-dependent aldolase [Candidatus Hodarchaeales archaeon]